MRRPALLLQGDYFLGIFNNHPHKHQHCAAIIGSLKRRDYHKQWLRSVAIRGDAAQG